MKPTVLPPPSSIRRPPSPPTSTWDPNPDSCMRPLRPAVGSVVAGRYRIQSCVGSAVFSTAVEALDLQTQHSEVRKEGETGAGEYVGGWSGCEGSGGVGVGVRSRSVGG